MSSDKASQGDVLWCFMLQYSRGISAPGEPAFQTSSQLQVLNGTQTLGYCRWARAPEAFSEGGAGPHVPPVLALLRQ